MPMNIEHIDAIARQKQRDVLYVQFSSLLQPGETHSDCRLRMINVDWQKLAIRQQIIDWLDQHGIKWALCGEFANTNVMMAYCGQIYIDVPYDKSLPEYRMLEEFLENPDGSMRHPDAFFVLVRLSQAMANAHHDEPGFWDDWAENF